jgi:hypothetical protein
MLTHTIPTSTTLAPYGPYKAGYDLPLPSTYPSP